MPFYQIPAVSPFVVREPSRRPLRRSVRPERRPQTLSTVTSCLILDTVPFAASTGDQSRKMRNAENSLGPVTTSDNVTINIRSTGVAIVNQID